MIIVNDAKMDCENLKKLNSLCDSIEKEAHVLNLSGFLGVRIINDELLYQDSDGHFKNMEILLPKTKTSEYLCKGMEYLLTSTIYHELCHVDLYNRLPNLHAFHSKSMEADDSITAFTIMIFIEYLAHLMSNKYETEEIQKNFFDSINKKKWDFNNEIDKILFAKYSPYVIGRDQNNNYTDKFENIELKKRLAEIKSELEKIANYEYFDDYKYLKSLEILIRKYIKNY